jgi:hypothetical protein
MIRVSQSIVTTYHTQLQDYVLKDLGLRPANYHIDALHLVFVLPAQATPLQQAIRMRLDAARSVFPTAPQLVSDKLTMATRTHSLQDVPVLAIRFPLAIAANAIPWKDRLSEFFWLAVFLCASILFTLLVFCPAERCGQVFHGQD